MTVIQILAALLALSAAAPLRADLKKALAEPDLGKRSKLALDNAFTAYQAARDAYRKGEMAPVQASIDEVEKSVDLAYQSLNDTGKNPRKSPRWFKSAELATRDLARRIASFQDQMRYNDRPMLDKLKVRVQQRVHDDLLLGLMEGQEEMKTLLWCLGLAATLTGRFRWPRPGPRLPQHRRGRPNQRSPGT